MKFEIKQGWERASRQLVCHLRVQTKETNVSIKMSEDGTLRIRTFDRNTEEVLMDKEMTIGKFMEEDGDEQAA